MESNEKNVAITTGDDARLQRGIQIASLAKIEKDGLHYIVPSQYSGLAKTYKVWAGLKPTCTCPDFEIRGQKCKHIFAVECVIKRETTHHRDGSKTIKESVIITKTRKSYPQDWPAYNEAQTNEKRDFQRLLHDLCRDLPPLPVSEKRKGPQGRKPLPLPEAVFCAVFKVYSTMSARRFTSDLCDAQEKRYISRVPHFNSVLNVLETPEVADVLTDLIIQASLPLRSVESNFAVDSTGFAFSRFVRWFDIKYGKFTSEQQWIKAHICTGVKTNIITAIEIHERYSNDALHLPSLVETTAENFTMKEVSADKGYTGRENHDSIAKVGAVPYIAFKTNATGAVGGLYAKMFHYFQFKRDDFLAHYHQRSNVESTVMMVKSKFGDAVRSKTDVAAKNEVLAKILCHNLCCNISAIYELGINPVFGMAAPTLPV